MKEVPSKGIRQEGKNPGFSISIRRDSHLLLGKTEQVPTASRITDFFRRKKPRGQRTVIPEGSTSEGTNRIGELPPIPPDHSSREVSNPDEFYRTYLYSGGTLRDFMKGESPTYHTIPPKRETSIAEDPETAIERGAAELSFIQVDAAVKDLGLNACMSEDAQRKSGSERDAITDLESRGMKVRFVDTKDSEIMHLTLFAGSSPYSIYTFTQGKEDISPPWKYSQSEGLQIAKSDDTTPPPLNSEAYIGVREQLQSVVSATASVYLEIPYKKK